MKILCETGLEIVRERTAHTDGRHDVAWIQKHHEELTDMMEQSLQHLKDAKACQSMRDQLEHWNLYLHRSYILRDICIENLGNTVDAFLGLQNVTRFATQSWAAVHRSLSSALLLAILKKPKDDPRVRSSLDKLIIVMSSINSSLDPTEVSAPISRAVKALSRLNAHPGFVASSETSSAGFLTPAPAPAWERSNSSDYLSFMQASNDGAMEDGVRSEHSPLDLVEKILWGYQGISPP